MTTEKLNPEIKDFQYGKRELKTVKLYPLSIRDQKELTELIPSFMEKIGSTKELTEGQDSMIFSVMADLITDNLEKVVSLACCTDEKESEEIAFGMTNNQVMEFITYIWESNYEEVLKNGRNLFEKMQMKEPGSKRSLPSSVKNTVIKSKKSSKKASKKGD